MKLFKVFISFILSICMMGVITLSANGVMNYKDYECIKSMTDVTSRDINGMATLYQSVISSYNNNNITSTKLANHATHWVELNNSIKTSDVRLVQYTSGSASNWQGKKPSELAQIFERENPGWMVLAGINNDFFYISDNDEPLGTSMQEGDLYKPYNYYGGGHQAIGFKTDGSYIYGTPDISGNEYVEKLNSDGTYTDVTMINTVDKTPKGVTLLTRFGLTKSPYAGIPEKWDLPYDLSTYKVVKVNYSTQRYDRNTKKVFVKGTVVDITSGTATYKLDDADACSYLVTTGSELDTLELGDEIRCQCKVQNDWADVTNIAGAYSMILKDNKIINHVNPEESEIEYINSWVNHDYVNCIKNRTIMGFKADGTPIIMNVEKGSYGASYHECAAYLKSLGCVNGFLFDGGGSADLFIRNEAGKFELINKQEDGSERSDANAIFLVTRDPGFKITTTDTTRFTTKVVLNVTNKAFFSSVSNIKVTLNGETKDYADGGVTFDQLTENTTYDIKVAYEVPSYADSSKKVSASLTSKVETEDFVKPDPGLSVIDKTKSTITVKKDMTKPTASWIKDVVVHIGDYQFNMGDKEEMVCDQLIDGENYEVYFEYTIYDGNSSNTYKMQTEPIYVKTLSFDKPYFVDFSQGRKTDNSVTFNYQYRDPDSKAVKAYFVVNGEAKDALTGKSDSVKFDNLDFTNNDYEFKVVIEYVDDEGQTLTVESETIKLEKTKPQTPPNDNPPTTPEPEKPTKKKCGKKSMGLVLSLIGMVTVLSFVLNKKKW